MDTVLLICIGVVLLIGLSAPAPEPPKKEEKKEEKKEHPPIPVPGIGGVFLFFLLVVLFMGAR